MFRRASIILEIVQLLQEKTNITRKETAPYGRRGSLSCIFTLLHVNAQWNCKLRVRRAKKSAWRLYVRGAYVVAVTGSSASIPVRVVKTGV